MQILEWGAQAGWAIDSQWLPCGLHKGHVCIANMHSKVLL
jgi:hypothetical protein